MSPTNPPATQLAILGASVRAAAHSALRGGYQVLAFDQFADADVAARCPATRVDVLDDRLVKMLDDAAADAWLYTGGMENRPELVDQLAAATPLYGCDAAVLSRVRDPWWLAGTLTAAAYCFPAISRQPPTIDPQQWLRKRFHSGGGLAIERLNEATTAPQTPSDHYYQRLVPGRPISGMYLADGHSCHLLAVFEQWIGQPWTGAASEFLFCGAVGPIAIDDPIRDQMKGIGSLLTERAGIRGLFGIDFVLAEAELTLIEVNPRYTASMEIWERASGRSAIEVHCRACQGDRLQLPPLAAHELFSKAIVYADAPLTIGPEFQQLSEQLAQGAWPSMADIPHAGQAVGKREPICTVFGQGTSCTAATLAVQRLAELVRTQANGRESADR